MGKITKITKQRKNPKRVSVYINGEFCTGMEEKVLKSLNLKVGDEMDCEKLKKEVKLFWKKRYKKSGKKKKVEFLQLSIK